MTPKLLKLSGLVEWVGLNFINYRYPNLNQTISDRRVQDIGGVAK